jgi:type I restriction enzyme S subunit
VSSSIRAGVSPVDGWSPSEASADHFTYIDIASIDREAKEVRAPSTLPVAEAPSRARQLVRAGDVLVSTVRPNLNAVALVPPELDGAVASTGFTVLRADPRKLDRRFLFHWVRSPSFVRDMEKKATGASYPAVSDRIVLESPMPMPAPAEQRRIADILDKADAIRRKRKEAIALTEELLRSTFLEMFGDPVTNPKGWPVKPLHKFGEVTTGSTPPRAQPELFGDAIEWIKSDNLNTPSHFLTPAAEGLSSKGREVARIVPSGSSLITCIAGSPDCIGNVGLADRAVSFNQQINAVTPGRETDARFLYVMLLVGKRLIQAASTNSMKGMVSKGRLEQILFPSPPPTAQQRFGQLFDRFVALDGRAADAAGGADALFGSLVVRCFGNEAQEGARHVQSA